MGFKVMSDIDAEELINQGKQPMCYSGIPRQLSTIGKMLRTDE